MPQPISQQGRAHRPCDVQLPALPALALQLGRARVRRRRGTNDRAADERDPHPREPEADRVLEVLRARERVPRMSPRACYARAACRCPAACSAGGARCASRRPYAVDEQERRRAQLRSAATRRARAATRPVRRRRRPRTRRAATRGSPDPPPCRRRRPRTRRAAASSASSRSIAQRSACPLPRASGASRTSTRAPAAAAIAAVSSVQLSATTTTS